MSRSRPKYNKKDCRNGKNEIKMHYKGTLLQSSSCMIAAFTSLSNYEENGGEFTLSIVNVRVKHRGTAWGRALTNSKYIIILYHFTAT